MDVFTFLPGIQESSKKATWKARLRSENSAEILLHLTLLASKPRKAMHKPRRSDREFFRNRKIPLNIGERVAVVALRSFLFFLLNRKEATLLGFDRSIGGEKKIFTSLYHVAREFARFLWRVTSNSTILFTGIRSSSRPVDATWERMRGMPLLTVLIVDRSSARRRKEFDLAFSLALSASSGAFSAAASCRPNDFLSAPRSIASSAYVRPFTTIAYPQRQEQ